MCYNGHEDKCDVAEEEAEVMVCRLEGRCQHEGPRGILLYRGGTRKLGFFFPHFLLHNLYSCISKNSIKARKRAHIPS